MNIGEVLGQAFLVLIPMVLSLTVHEFAHAWSAKVLGDDTAESMGRLNLNPLSHADPMGTFLLPLFILLANGAMGPSLGGGGIPFFGWAKPVPVNPGRFSRKINLRNGMMLVAAAGPLSNLLLALISAAVFSYAIKSGYQAEMSPPMQTLLVYMLQINVALFVFNMIPVYPLDGQKVLSGVLSHESAVRFERFSYQWGSLILMFIIFFARGIIAYPVFIVQKGVLSVVGLG